MKFNQLKNKKILILGKGLEGQATYQILKKFFPDQTIEIIDQKDDPRYLERVNNFDVVIKSPGIPGYLLKTNYTTPTNIFFSNIKNKTIGVTGSKGKSTTASLIFQILKHGGYQTELIGNIGKPSIEVFLNKINPETIYVVELSSYQLSDIQFSPWISVITALFKEHLDYHLTLKNYYQSKKNIIRFATKKNYFIYHPRYRLLKQWAKEFIGIAIPSIKKLPFKINNPKIIGQHNLENIKLAYAVARIFKIPDQKIKKAIDEFTPLPHRLEYLGTFKNISFYNDAIATTPQATIGAIKALKNIGCLILGGLNRGYNFLPLMKLVNKQRIPVLIFFPNSGKKMKEYLYQVMDKDYSPRILETIKMDEAVKFAYQHTPPKTICLLSTASPSYSLWKNFEEKGNLFKKFVFLYAHQK